MSDKHYPLYICLFLIVATAAVYWPTLKFDFVNFDDPVYVTNNHHVKQGITAESIKWAFLDTQGNWYPITWLSHMLDCQWFGLNAGLHHLTSLLLHILNTLLLFFVLKKMTGDVWPSFLVAGLFALHPLHVESVAWISERKDVLSTLFWLLTLWGYFKWCQRPNRIRYLVIVMLYALGLMAKPMLVTLPFVLLLTDYWPLRRIHIEKPKKGPTIPLNQQIIIRMGEKIPLFILAAGSSFVTFFVQEKVGAVRSFDFISFDTRIANALISYLNYLVKMVWPSRLTVFYPYPETFLTWKIITAFLIIAGISLISIIQIKKRPYLIVGWLWYVGTLVPVIGLIQVGRQAMADRYTYIPLIGIFVMIAWGSIELVDRWPRFRKAFGIFGIVVFSLLLMMTWNQVQYWKDSVTLFERSLSVTTHNFVAHNNLGKALAAQDRNDEAMGHYQEALRIKQDYASPAYNMGNVLTKQERYAEAVRYYQTALKNDPEMEAAHYNLGLIRSRQGRIDEAIQHYQRALRINPESADTHNNLGLLFAKQGRTEMAISHYEKAIKSNPGYVVAYFNFGNVLLVNGRTSEAIQYYLKALQFNPHFVEAFHNLGIAYLQKGDRRNAVNYFRKALAENPRYTPARESLAAVLGTQNRKQ